MKSKRLVAGVNKPVSELVLGTAWYSREEKEQWFGLMDDFVACGGTAIDTARGYGESEEVIGLWMEARANREQIFIITKGGLSKEDGTRLAVEGLRKKVESDINQSLEMLRTDYIDLFFLHRDTSSIPVGEIVDCLNAELESGRIQAFGGSNWELRRVDEANEYAAKHGMVGFAAVSNNISLAVPTGPFYEGLVSTDKAGQRWHRETGIPLFSWSSQARGFFTGRFRPGKNLSSFETSMVQVYGTEENFKRLHRAKELGERKGGYSAVQIALAWVLHLPFTVLPIVGPHRKEELASCVTALSIKLNKSELKWLNLE